MRLYLTQEKTAGMETPKTSSRWFMTAAGMLLRRYMKKELPMIKFMRIKVKRLFIGVKMCPRKFMQVIGVKGIHTRYPSVKIGVPKTMQVTMKH